MVLRSWCRRLRLVQSERRIQNGVRCCIAWRQRLLTHPPQRRGTQGAGRPATTILIFAPRHQDRSIPRLLCPSCPGRCCPTLNGAARFHDASPSDPTRSWPPAPGKPRSHHAPTGAPKKLQGPSDAQPATRMVRPTTFPSRSRISAALAFSRGSSVMGMPGTLPFCASATIAFNSFRLPT